MKALSVRQPWAWAILHAGKRIENRTWSNVPRAMIGQRFAIHAAKGCTATEYEDADLAITLATRDAKATDPTLPSLAALPRGAIVGTARLVDVVRVHLEGHHKSLSDGGNRCTLCGAQRGAVERCPKADPWAIPGALGLVLDEVVELPAPIPCKGALGFFDVPDELLRGLAP